jgi:hypothetical protein
VTLFGLRPEQMRATLAQLRAYLAAGDSETLIAEKMGLSWEDYEALKKELYASEEDRLHRRSTGQVYVDYVIAQEQNIKDLSTMIEKFDVTKQYNAMVGAVRARSEILDKIVERGQEFGFIEKRPEVKMILGVPVGQLSDKQLRETIQSELKAIGAMQQKYGESVNIVDIDPGDVHTEVRALPEPADEEALAPPVPAGKVKRHARAKIHGGRRVKRGSS